MAIAFLENLLLLMTRWLWYWVIHLDRAGAITLSLSSPRIFKREAYCSHAAVRFAMAHCRQTHSHSQEFARLMVMNPTDPQDRNTQLPEQTCLNPYYGKSSSQAFVDAGSLVQAESATLLSQKNERDLVAELLADKRSLNTRLA